MENGRGGQTVKAKEADDGVIAQSGQVECVPDKERYPAHWVSDVAQKIEVAANYQ